MSRLCLEIFLMIRTCLRRRIVELLGVGFGKFTDTKMIRLAVSCCNEKENKEYGGEGGIRTHGARKGSTVFETARFNRSRTSPLFFHYTSWGYANSVAWWWTRSPCWRIALR